MTEDYTDLEVKLDYAYRDTVANQLSGLDRFGRIVDQVWAEYGVYPLPPVPGGLLDEYGYTYDRAGNRTSRTNALDWALSEIYAYDPLNRLTSSDRYDGSAADQSWGLDAAGNLGAVTTAGTTQTRTSDAANEVSTINGVASVHYDAAGNMTTLSSGTTAKYDAWNRLVEVDSPTGTEKYVYDGLNRRVAKTNQDGSMDQYYYNQQWQVVEDNRVVSNVTHWVEQYVWSARGGDAPIARLHDGDVDGDATDDPYTRYGVSDWSCYYTTDANGNVTTAVRYDNYSHAVETVGDGLGVNHYSYTAYGAPRRYDQSWTAPAGPIEDGPLYCGYFYDLGTQLYQARNRYYDPTLSAFISHDPIGYASGDDNLYAYCGGDPINATDPRSLSGTGGSATTGPIGLTLPRRRRGEQPRYPHRQLLPA